MTTILLHGFWGQPADWQAVIERLPLSKPLEIPDLYSPGPLAPTTTFGAWSAEFWNWVDHLVGRNNKVQIVGYSMGGRLAVSAVLSAPPRVHRALFLSANPLAIDPGERETWELSWCQRFREQDWHELEKRWQEQEVFAQAQNQRRRHSPALREALALSLLNWSPRHQRFALGDLAALPATTAWAFGALDQKYSTVANTLQELPVQGQICVIPGVGHRLPLEAADFVSQWIEGV